MIIFVYVHKPCDYPLLFLPSGSHFLPYQEDNSQNIDVLVCRNAVKLNKNKKYTVVQTANI